MRDNIISIIDLDFRPLAFKIGNAVNVLLFALTFFLAIKSSAWLILFLIGIPSVAVPWFLYKSTGDSQLARVSYGVSFMFFVALQIHLSMGMTELHFGIFVLLAILVVFRDWIVIAAAAVVIAVHHLLFMYLQVRGASVYVLPESDLSYSIVFIHALYVVAESIVLIVIARASLREAKVSQSFLNITRAMSQDQKLNLTYRMEDLQSDSVNQFNHALEKLNEVVLTIKKSSMSIRKNANVLLETGDSLSEDMKAKLKEVQQIAAATEEMSITSNQTAELADTANSSADEASRAVTKGRNAVITSKTGMSRLTERLQSAKQRVEEMSGSVDDIKNVLAVINTIAEQTNLLALNAAIEAARAGEQGRGFAVVADEVRQLASQTQGSTEQIQKSIASLVAVSDASVKIVLECVDDAASSLVAVENTGVEFDNIERSAERVRESVLSIATALEEQTKATSEIAASIQYLSDMEEKQTYQAEEVLKEASSMETTSTKLDQQTERFIA